MTGQKGNSEFCFPETLNVPRGEAVGNIEVKGKQNSLFPEGPVIKCFVIPPDSKIEKAPKKLCGSKVQVVVSLVVRKISVKLFKLMIQVLNFIYLILFR